MTEAEWLVCEDARRLANSLPAVGRRKSLLAAVALCRRFWPHPPGSALREQLDLVDRFVEGAATEDEMGQTLDRLVAGSDRFIGDDEAAMIGVLDLVALPRVPLESALRFAKRTLGGWEVSVIRCVFGNPFRQVTADPSWLTSTVVALAAGIYEERAFDRLPILADALQDAGCDNPDVLAHCRGPGPHVRGCWVVDGVLGKS